MPPVFPFRAIRYGAISLDGDLSDVLAPPYDVLEEGDKKTLLDKSEHNIVAVDLPFVPPKTAGPAEVYAAAADRLRQWLDEGILIREAAPNIYIYHQRFRHEGREHLRKMFIANLRLAAFSEGAILPHEQTFGGPKEDRLALMKATKCQLSPIFGLYTDPDGQIEKLLAAPATRSPDALGMLDDVENRLWAVPDAGLIQQVSAAFTNKKVYIADGHHRYGTALLYREWVTGQNGGRLAGDHAANFITFVLASMDDPGCLILPYHRVLGGIGANELVRAWSAGAAPAESRSADIRLWEAGGREVPLGFTNRKVLPSLAPGQPAAWYDLDYAYLHTYLIDGLLAAERVPLPKTHYVKSSEQAKQIVREQGGVALLMNATKMSQLRAVSEAGGLMPQKSTYFHPKLATGITINSLE